MDYQQGEKQFDATSWFDNAEEVKNNNNNNRPNTRGSIQSRGGSRPNTRGNTSRPGTRNTNRSSSRASTPQLVEPLKPVTPQHAAAASLIAFQIIGHRVCKINCVFNLIHSLIHLQLLHMDMMPHHYLLDFQQ